MKKIISFLLAVTIIFSMSSAVSFAKVGDTLLSAQTFENYTDGYSYSVNSNNGIDKWKMNRGSSDTNTKVTIKSDGSNKYAEVTNKGYIEYFNDITDLSNIPVVTIKYKVKFSDFNAVRYLLLKGNNGVSGGVVKFNTDGTVSVGDSKKDTGSWKGVSKADGTYYTCSVDTWYTMTVVVDSSNKLVDLVIDDGKTTCSGEWKIVQDFSNMTMLYFYNEAAKSNTTSTMCIDDVEIIEGGSIQTVNINFDEYTASDAGIPFTSACDNGVTPEYSYVEREGNGMALKVDYPGNKNYWQAYKLHSDVKYTSGVVLAETDVYFPDKNINRALCMRMTYNGSNNKQVAIVTFMKDGIKVGSTIYDVNVFAYEFGPNAPWYNVKAYFEIATGKVRVEISDGIVSKVFYDKLENTGGNITGIDYLTTKGTGVSSNVSTYFDNLSLSSYINEDPDFFTADFIYDFDNITPFDTNTVSYFQNSNDGWYVQNTISDSETAASATPAEIDGRDAVKLWSNGKTHFEVLNWLPSNTITRYSADIRVDSAGKINIQALGIKSDASTKTGTNLSVIDNFTVTMADGTTTIGTLNSGKWYRIAYTFDITNATYTAKLIDLENNQKIGEASSSLGELAIMNRFVFYLPQSANLIYLDNVCYSGNTIFSIISDTNDASTVDAAFGVDVVTNDMIDPSATVYTLNNGNSGAWADANTLNKVSFSYLEPNTEYTLNYTVANLYGDTATGEITFKTGTAGYGLSGLAIDSENDGNGYMSAEVNGRLSKGEDAQLMVAVYEKNDGLELVGLDIVQITSAKEIKDYVATVKIPDTEKQYIVKAFLWDGVKPLLTNVTSN